LTIKFLFCHYTIGHVKITFSLALALVAMLSLIFVISPQALAGSVDGSKTHHKYWVISIGDKSGTIEITERSDIEQLKQQAISYEETTAGYENVVKARLSQAVNDSGQYYLVWNVVTEPGDAEDSTYTKNIIDAGTGELLTSITKEGGECGYKKSGTTSTEGQA
jgi:hypothetical protein